MMLMYRRRCWVKPGGEAVLQLQWSLRVEREEKGRVANGLMMPVPHQTMYRWGWIRREGATWYRTTGIAY